MYLQSHHIIVEYMAFHSRVNCYVVEEIRCSLFVFIDKRYPVGNLSTNL